MRSSFSISAISSIENGALLELATARVVIVIPSGLKVCCPRNCDTLLRAASVGLNPVTYTISIVKEVNLASLKSSLAEAPKAFKFALLSTVGVPLSVLAESLEHPTIKSRNKKSEYYFRGFHGVLRFIKGSKFKYNY
ncbi:hypothetical protein [Gillisia marina]|uniref:hypothetical protein n=1 Tax=Gillisia marina TaxID=1167637 RepID=UPI00029A8001|nr:hypothetical protein [Gillisia marina]